MSTIPTLRLADGNNIPSFKDGDEDQPVRGGLDTKLISTLKDTLNAGYTHFDCAEPYGNEIEFGIAIKESSALQDKVFITSKVQGGIADISGALVGSLKRLQTKYLDLCIPNPHTLLHSRPPLSAGSWSSMENLKESGKVRSIGVSNFQQHHLKIILETAADKLVINQLEFHPYHQRSRDYIPWH
ncbi:Aldo/keto reductase [Lophiostoma macrostomum CBS 122681]|uniref:Aldo/keto reductase n=1 Tax=Lophiostoma macrostomum CBS 122681 TaxID=1314788 RepID=A0A6A6STA3_9PLEO|nr:Aldo/keto reductase [Lophiostoma macrostomum CBS 122681]